MERTNQNKEIDTGKVGKRKKKVKKFINTEIK
jgi:hypothetical protein